MSASLVGSEMCIRDRWDDYMKETFKAAAVDGCPGSRASQNLRCRCPGPVSYTHLTLPTICSV
eukprot:11801205-Alexandrium_andersonii.AAC.1